ncbi:hypothetical protein NONI108955_05745 [Nocardia ninae]|uniref:Uncharacterized protein n=1 Tax=Nocardia ninae NBRC 108245 TaxID=1210091 RepID=A0A511MFJ9_9NOCA|nr:hypothetical protein [Nocardia ninae]GEM38857.1 hypothetical protein NN4_33760 [Nocardia ninae NBRC 108245]
MSRIPTEEQWLQAIKDRQAHVMCFEAIGYARGYCDTTGIGSGDAIDFGRAYSVLVASHRSRPSIESAWSNWQAGLDVGASPGDLAPASPNPQRLSESGSAPG